MKTGHYDAAHPVARATVYIAGPMSGIENFNYEAFHRAAAQLAAEGYAVRNPAANFGGEQTLPYETYIRQAIADVSGSHWVYCLPGWRDSRGARLEAHIAATLRLPVWEELPSYAVDIGGAAQKARVRVRFSGHGTPLPLEQNAPLAPSIQAVGIAPVTAPIALTPVPGAAVDGAGYKASMDDPKKPPLGLIPTAMLNALGRSLGHGAAKYAPHNYRRGMKWSEPYSAILRHLSAWADGEDVDADSGNHHLDNAAAMLAFLIEYVTYPYLYAKFDDRFKRPTAALEVSP